ncbi:hypothetical protein CC78DRAFT_533957 [Lojkania enalia]|uniref:Uncharacterized protein n=1 Tax=Lojkania enalia TaxID=147567 RepID=A0A9P4K7I8_9PLEO|nr:hypothetical protein CC78DRAFT_533957 [Didymosphaeria enalia]
MRYALAPKLVPILNLRANAPGSLSMLWSSCVQGNKAFGSGISKLFLRSVRKGEFQLRERKRDPGTPSARIPWDFVHIVSVAVRKPRAELHTRVDYVIFHYDTHVVQSGLGIVRTAWAGQNGSLVSSRYDFSCAGHLAGSHPG